VKKWQLCAVALVGLLTAFISVGQVRQREEKAIASTAASQVLWKFDTGG
jgi:hypothetical protein